MFDPKSIFPIVRRTITKGTDAQVMQALTKLAQAHPDLNGVQAMAALQHFAKTKGAAAAPKRPDLSAYLGGRP